MARRLAVLIGAAAMLAAFLSGGPAGATTVRPAPAAVRSTPAATPGFRVATRALPPGIRGLSYLTVLSADGGTAPYAWSAARLPAGLRLSAAGLLTGYPLILGSQPLAVRVRDARGRESAAGLRLAVPSSLPGGCVARSCAQLAASPRTVTVPARDIVAVTGLAAPAAGGTGAAGAGRPGQVVLRDGIPVAAGDILALAAAPAVPSGLVAVAESVTAGNRETVVAVRTATPASAFAAGTVQAAGGPGQTRSPRPVSGGGGPAPDGTLSCAGGVTSQLHGLSVTPSLAPAFAAQWRQERPGLPVRGAQRTAGFPGALRLFQFTLAGTITVNLGVSVSGPARCAMTLSAVQRTLPAGGLGAVVLRLRPVLNLVTTGELDVATSVTLTCGVTYRLYAGRVTSTDQCSAAHQPLEISSLGAASARVTGAVAVSAALDGLNVVTGTADAALRAGYHPGGGTVTETAASSGFHLTAPLDLLWNGAPRAAVADGTAFAAVLARSATRPPSATGPSAVTVTPAVAYPWSDAVCGYHTPTFGHAAFRVAGGGFVPGERAGVTVGLARYPAAATAGPGGSFTVINRVGEVGKVLNQEFGVTADGSAGSSARSSIELDADGCLLQSATAGRLRLRWGGNGFDPGAGVSLSVNGTVVGAATTDSHGSGGATAELSCPAAGRYQWQVRGTVNGGPAAAAGWLSCRPRPGSPRGRETVVRQRAGAAAAGLPVRLPWRAPPGRPPLT